MSYYPTAEYQTRLSAFFFMHYRARQEKQKLEFTLGSVFCECSLKSMLAALGGIVCGGISLGSKRRRARKLFSGRDFGEKLDLCFLLKSGFLFFCHILNVISSGRTKNEGESVCLNFTCVGNSKKGGEIKKI